MFTILQLLVCFSMTIVVKITCVPIESTTESSNSYDLSNFAEVYDQRQNGSENVQVDIDGVVLIWAPLAGPSKPPLSQVTLDHKPTHNLNDLDYSEIEQLLLSQLSHAKPEDLIVVNPEASSSSTTAISQTTKVPPPRSPIKGNNRDEVPVLKRRPASRRRFRIPGFFQSFIRD